MHNFKKIFCGVFYLYISHTHLSIHYVCYFFRTNGASQSFIQILLATTTTSLSKYWLRNNLETIFKKLNIFIANTLWYIGGCVNSVVRGRDHLAGSYQDFQNGMVPTAFLFGAWHYGNGLEKLNTQSYQWINPPLYLSLQSAYGNKNRHGPMRRWVRLFKYFHGFFISKVLTLLPVFKCCDSKIYVFNLYSLFNFTFVNLKFGKFETLEMKWFKSI